MTKIEFIERYGEEAYKRRLECQKQYREQHKEEIKQYREKNKQYQKQYREQHKEEAKQYYQQHKEQKQQYLKQYYQQHKEQKKQYYQQHREEINKYQKQWNRKNIAMFAYCIPEEWEQIENYESAKKDSFKGWHIHHRLETHNSDGEKRLVNISREELKAMDMYYNRPANELVFLTNSEHIKLHRK